MISSNSHTTINDGIAASGESNVYVYVYVYVSWNDNKTGNVETYIKA